jgi:hypothetical protein
MRTQTLGSTRDSYKEVPPISPLPLSLLLIMVQIGNYFQVHSHRKELFDQVAHRAGFDPTGQDHRWHDVTRKDVLSYPVRNLCGEGGASMHVV